MLILFLLQIKILNSTENNAEELVIENKIYSIEAQKKGILLSDDSINEIENICNSNEILDYVQNDDKVRDNFKKRIKTYLTDNEYKQALNDRILYEIYNNCISISNEEINEKMKEYINVKEDFKKIENPSEEERADCLNKTATLLFEIQDLYLQNIKDKYLIETIK